jgi:YVTN family beta-propeller protein
MGHSVNVIDRAHGIVATIPIGFEPKRTRVSADGSRIYVTGYDGSISIINANDHTQRTVTADPSAAEAVSRNGGLIYLAHNEGRNCWVSAVTDDGSTAAVVPVDSYACALTLSAGGDRLYVASSKPRSTNQRSKGSISVIDTATLTLIDVIPLQFAPDTILVSANGSRIYATHYNENAISTIELASRSHLLIALDDAPLDIALSPIGDELYVTSLHSLAVVDTATNFAESMPIGDLPRQLNISGDGKRAYLTDFAHRTVWVLDAVNKTVIATVDLGRDPEALTVTTDEQFVYVADYLTPSIRVISLVSAVRSTKQAG